MNVTVDFDKSAIIGTNTLTLEAVADGVSEVVIDYQGLLITLVEIQGTDGNFYQVNISYKEWFQGNFETYNENDQVIGAAMRVFLTDSMIL